MNVPRQAAHEEAERQLKSLTARRQTMRDNLDALTARAGRRITPALRKAMQDLSTVEDEMANVRQALLPMRAAHAAAVKAGFDPACRAAAERALAAMFQVEQAVNEINAMRAEVRLVGGEASNIAATKIMIPLVMHLRAIVEPAK